MTRVLFVAYYFPPVGGSGVQRTVKFIRYLPEFGVTSAVVTGPTMSHGVGEPRDATLMEELPLELEVLRLGGTEPGSAGRWRRRFERWTRRASAWSGWWIEGVAATGRQARGIDVVLATGSPFESFEAARRLANALRVPWVADLRDPWALDEMLVYPTGLHRRLEVRKMGKVLASAAAVVMNTPEAAHQLTIAFPQLPGRVLCIPNGYDAADFDGAVVPTDDDVLRITHVGSLHTAQGTEHRRVRRARRALGGMLGDVDILSRSHIYLLEALEELIARKPDATSQIQLHLAGDLSPEDRSAIRLDLVRQHGYLNHDESVRLVRSAGLLFLPMHNLPPDQRARIVPGKTYEYAASGRPILAAVPEGDARDLIAAIPNSYVCRPDDVEGMRAAIEMELERRRRRDPASPIEQGVLARYERRELTRQLAELLHDVARISSSPT